MEVGKIEGVASILGGEGELGRFVGAEVTTLTLMVWGFEGCRTAGSIGCGGWETRWEYWTEPWGRERAGKLSISHEKRKIFRKQKKGFGLAFLIVYQIFRFPGSGSLEGGASFLWWACSA